MAAVSHPYFQRYLKYNPLLFSNSGSKAAYKTVCAPEYAVLVNGQNRGLKIYLERKA